MTCIPLRINPAADRPWDVKLERDLRTLGLFVELYCRGKHPEAEKELLVLRMADNTDAVGRPLTLCPDCIKLVTHAVVKRSSCPMRPKPQCKHCPNHCYAPKYQAEIRQAMRYSGQQLIMKGRLDYLWHLLF